MDNIIFVSATLFILLMLLLAGGVWIAISLIGAGIAALVLFTPAPAGSFLVLTAWGASSQWTLTALPLFIWMGEILFRTRASGDLFAGLSAWTSRLPGGLLHVNVLGSGVMAAVTGSSAATAATVGRISIPELSKRGYDEQMMIGSLAGSGTLGLLIPPSIVMIVYGVTAQQSIARLFIAGILPGLLLVALYMGYIAIWSTVNKDKTPSAEPKVSFKEKLKSSRRLIPIVLLIVVVIGSIYGGYATPTEAATLGIVGSLVLAVVERTLTWSAFMSGALAATRVSCMIIFIIIGAACLTKGVGYVGLPTALATWVDGLGLSSTALLAILGVLILIMGCFLEGISIIVLTSAILLPMVETAGINLLWFGIFLTILIEAAQITPPVGFNLFVLQSITSRDIWRVTVATTPFFLILILFLVVVIAVPEIVTFLPSLMS